MVVLSAVAQTFLRIRVPQLNFSSLHQRARPRKACRADCPGPGQCRAQLNCRDRLLLGHCRRWLCVAQAAGVDSSPAIGHEFDPNGSLSSATNA
jgi:hypothetical protein